jgi:8-amino-7-oxononanoate synthase
VAESNTTFAADSFMGDSIDALKSAGLLRHVRNLEGAPGPRIIANGRSVLLLCSNNYLGLATDERLKQAARETIEKYGCGATGSRLISGSLEPYTTLERELADWKGREAALVFASGYQANLGTIPALVEPGDTVFSDALNHASIIDGCRLSRAEVIVYNHCDADDLERKLAARASAGRKLIVTESVFSMDGDVSPLPELAHLAQRYSAMLMVDEAHATGILGPTGGGLVEELGLQSRVDVQMGTFSKALGSLGGYIAGSRDLIQYLTQKARTFVFTTGLPPAVLAASTAALRIARAEPERRAALRRIVQQLREGLSNLGFSLGPSRTQILPIFIGDDRETMTACRFLLRHGVFVQAIRPPTVPSGTARLRVAPTASHSKRDIADALTAFRLLQEAFGSHKLRNSRRQSTSVRVTSLSE